MRYDVKKYLFVGPKSERDAFFEKAQELGMVHFIEKKAISTKKIPDDVQNILTVLKVLRGLPTMEQEEIEDPDIADGLVAKILSLKETRDKLAEEVRILNLEKARVAIFGDFSWDQLHQIEAEAKKKIQFYFAKQGFADQPNLPPELVYVGTDSDLDYFMAFNPTPRQYPKMQEILIPHPIGEVNRLHKEKVEEHHKVDQRLKTYAKYDQYLRKAMIQKLNQYHLHEAQGKVEFPIGETLFAIEGWIPVNKDKELSQLIQERNVHGEEIAIEPTDAIPTYLENRGVARVGEDLVHVYDTPSITDKDPSLYLLFFFALFFALIIGDGGYGLLFLAAGLFIRYKYTLKGLGKRMTNLLLILGAFCLAWGLLTSSFFGISLNMENPLRKISFLQWMVEKKAAYHIAHQDETWAEWVKEIPQLQNVQDPKEFVRKGFKEEHGKMAPVVYDKFADNVMFELALFIGVIHISISLLRNLYRNWAGIGWILFIIGAYLYLPGFLKATSLIHYVFGVDKATAPQNGIYLMVGGLVIALILALIKHRGMGILEPMHGIQIFSDTMSYLRLYALGLAGAMLAMVINDLASGTPFVIGLLIIIFGHTVNILLSIMSGVIHGLRLNYLEWYHYSFEGDGKQFDPLQKLKEES